MGNSTMPFKIAIYDYACHRNSAFTIEDILRDLEAGYGGESQFNRNRIEEYLRSYLGIKFFAEEDIRFDERGELSISCKITDYGKTRMKYIPKH